MLPFLSVVYVGEGSYFQGLLFALYSKITPNILIGCQGMNPDQQCARKTPYLLTQAPKFYHFYIAFHYVQVQQFLFSFLCFRIMNIFLQQFLYPIFCFLYTRVVSRLCLLRVVLHYSQLHQILYLIYLILVSTGQRIAHLLISYYSNKNVLVFTSKEHTNGKINFNEAFYIL